MISQSLFFAYIDETESILVLACSVVKCICHISEPKSDQWRSYLATLSRASVIWNGPILKFFGLFFTCATLTVCVYRVEFLSRQTSISRWLILRGIFWKKQMHWSYLIFSQSEVPSNCHPARWLRLAVWRSFD